MSGSFDSKDGTKGSAIVKAAAKLHCMNLRDNNLPVIRAGARKPLAFKARTAAGGMILLGLALALPVRAVAQDMPATGGNRGVFN